ncbi:hypothetical protein KIH31_02290 [Paenarthrobacter sp. DKR-5]|uniref:hypothetical protein n=1 Tax=Paenarthrobacter sp. DKR-5 TaxID=2835535 RepID=UPI001BDC25C5|nr:hypothetical protein [Paenarthrobacter sp. DKR-5]MBT1001421.1 hypothetical protein [Paenarthrobacter sp. DKR-5]
MDDQAEARRELSARIDEQRASIREFLRRARPRRTRLTNISIIGSSLAAALTVGPATGGKKFTEAIQGLFSLSDDSVVWRLLCLAAVVLSVAAAVATNLANSTNVAAQVTAAETCNAELEGLQLSLSLGQLPLEDAIQAYRQSVAKVSFLDSAGVR